MLSLARNLPCGFMFVPRYVLLRRGAFMLAALAPKLLFMTGDTPFMRIAQYLCA